MTIRNPNLVQIRRQDGSVLMLDRVNLLEPQELTVGTSYGPVVELGDVPSTRADLVVSAKSGAMTSIDVTIQTSKDNVTWYDSGSFAQIGNDTGAERKCFPLDRFVRVKCVVVGSNAYTVRIDAEHGASHWGGGTHLGRKGYA
jgi:hypothetical protein